MKEKLNPLEKSIKIQSVPKDDHDRTRSRASSTASKKSLPPLPASAIKAVNDKADLVDSSPNFSRQKSGSNSSKTKVILNQLPIDHSKLVIPFDGNADVMNKLTLNPETKSNKLILTKMTLELRRINMKQLIETIKPLIENKITPLILDQSERCDIFFQYSGDFSGLFVEAKKILVETLIFKKVSMKETLENLRKILVNCLKFGRTLVLRMTDSACDFMNNFSHPDFFPASDLLIEAGQRFKKEEYWKRVVREQDLEHGTFIVKDEFCVVILSTLSVNEYKEVLENAIPISKCATVFIEPPSENPGLI